MATLIDAPEWTDNEIYQIAANDPVEGAAQGASFSGIGVSNEPHQQLANRTAFLKRRQDTNIANIGVLQAFLAKFVGSLQTNGYLEIPIADVSRGALVAIVQWGLLALPGTPLAAGVVTNTYSLNWPIAFPNACLWALGSGSGQIINFSDLTTIFVQVQSYTTTGGIFTVQFSDGEDLDNFTNPGIAWAAVGF